MDAKEKPKISEDLKEIASTTIESIKEGMKGKPVGLVHPIVFELSVIKSKEAKGGFRFLVADASGNYSKESISNIKFNVIGARTQHTTGFLWLHEGK